MVKNERIPCWYDLVWRRREGIILRIHSDFIAKSVPIKSNAPILDQYKNDFEFSSFGCEFGKDFGFQNCLRFLGQKRGFYEYLVPTPLIRKKSGKKCHYCDGSGKHYFFEGDKCHYCDGTGDEVVDDFSEAYAVCATINVLFNFMRFPDFETSCSIPQLMDIKTAVIHGPQGSSIGGQYSYDVVRWMEKRGPGVIGEIVYAMQTAWKRMEGRLERFDKLYFSAYLDRSPGWFCTSLPGSACGIHPDGDTSRSIIDKRGYEFSSHNVDSPEQQLVILASLAMLQNLVRRDFYDVSEFRS